MAHVGPIDLPIKYRDFAQSPFKQTVATQFICFECEEQDPLYIEASSFIQKHSTFLTSTF